MWRSLVVLCVIAGLAAGSSLQRGPREKKTGFGPGLATIVGTLGLLKIKAIFVSLIVFAVAAVFSRLLGSGCSVGGDLGCGAAALLPTAHSNVGSYSYDTYSGSGTGSGGYNYYNHRRSARGWDILDLSLEVLGLQSEDCKKKFICLSDNEALANPLLQLLMATFGASLDKYRHSAEGSDTTEPRDCDKLFPSCIKTQSKDNAPVSHDKPTNKLPRRDKDKNIHR